MIQTKGLADAPDNAVLRAAIIGPERTVVLVATNGDPGDAGPAAATRPERRQATALAKAWCFGAGLMAKALPCARRVLGHGRPSETTRASRLPGSLRPVCSRRRVNAPAISEPEPDVVRYFREGSDPGAFAEAAPQQVDYPPGSRRKLMRELGDPDRSGSSRRARQENLTQFCQKFPLTRHSLQELSRD